MQVDSGKLHGPDQTLNDRTCIAMGSFHMLLYYQECAEVDVVQVSFPHAAIDPAFLSNQYNSSNSSTDAASAFPSYECTDFPVMHVI